MVIDWEALSDLRYARALGSQYGRSPANWMYFLHPGSSRGVFRLARDSLWLAKVVANIRAEVMGRRCVGNPRHLLDGDPSG